MDILLLCDWFLCILLNKTRTFELWVQQTLPSVNVLNCVNIIRPFRFYRTNLQRRLNICMLVVEWTAAIFKTKCNAIDTRWFACLHFGRSLLCMVVVVAIFGIPLHYNHTQASTHSVIYSAHRSLLSIKSVKIDTQKIQGKTNDTLCSISIYLFIMGFYFRYLYTHFVLLSWIFYVFFAWKQKKADCGKNET